MPISESLFSEQHLGSVERLAQFRRDDFWQKDDLWTAESTKFLEPHSVPYFSPLCPLFFQQIKSIEVLDFFSPVLVRDGFLSLMDFFYRHPAPASTSPTEGGVLVVNWRFAPFIPKAWSDRICFYENRSRRAPDATHAGSRVVLLLISAIDERQASLASIQRRLRELKHALEKTGATPKVKVISFFNRIYARTRVGTEDKSRYYFKILKLIHAEFGGHAEDASWDEVKNSDLHHSCFLDLNEHDFYYSDSAVTQHLLRSGAAALSWATPPAEPNHMVSLSLKHSCAIWTSPTALLNPESPGASASADGVAFLESNAHRSDRASFSRKDSFERGEKGVPLSFEMAVFSLISTLNSVKKA